MRKENLAGFAFDLHKCHDTVGPLRTAFAPAGRGCRVLMGVHGLAGHFFRLHAPHQDRFFHLPSAVRNCSAVTGACLILRQETFWEAGGFEEELLPMAFQDVDLCLKLHEKGHRIVYTPHARLYHYESASKTTIAYQSEIDYMRKRWARYVEDDPYYNPNLTLISEGYTLRL